MRIRSVEAVPVNLPFHRPLSDSWGTYPSSNHGIVLVRSESGEYGVGEIALAWFGGAHALCKEVNDHWAERLIGLDVMDRTALLGVLDHLCGFSKRHLLAKAGIEMAIWDLTGKLLGLPVYKLMGGKLRDEIRLTGGISMATVEEMIESAVQKVSEGYRELKIKVGLDERRDIQTVRKIRDAVPDHVCLRVDANMVWRDPKTAKRIIDAMADFGVSIVEQPLHRDQVAELAWLRAHTRPLTLIDEGVWDVEDAKRHLDQSAADLLHVYISEAGGLDGARRIFELASLYRVDCTIGSMPEGRIGAAASAHIAAAMPNLSRHASDIRGFTVYRSDVTNEELVITDGNLIVPDRPGLGVTVDFDRLDAQRV